MGPLFQPSQEGPRKLKGGPEAPQKGFQQGFHSILENRGGGWRPGVTGGGNGDSDSTKSNKKKGQLGGWGGGAVPSPWEVAHLSLTNQVTCLVCERSKPTTSMSTPTRTAAHAVLWPKDGGHPVPS